MSSKIVVVTITKQHVDTSLKLQEKNVGFDIEKDRLGSIVNEKTIKRSSNEVDTSNFDQHTVFNY